MKKFNFKAYAQSGQLDADAQRAITRAIEQAEAAGLPRAYRPSPEPCEETPAPVNSPTSKRSA